MKKIKTNFQVVMEANKRTYSSSSGVKRIKLPETKSQAFIRTFYGKFGEDARFDLIMRRSKNSTTRKSDEYEYKEQDISEVTIIKPSSSRPSTACLNMSSGSCPDGSIKKNCDIRLSPTKNNNIYGISPSSLKTLAPGCMLNDDIVEFYLNYVTSRLKPDIRKRMHLFSSFLYEKLQMAIRKKDPNIFDETCLRWEKGVRVFDKDFLVIPVCQHAHWKLVIVCYPRNVGLTETEDEIVAEALQSKKFDAPSILIFDSLNFRHLPKFAEPIRKFLMKRWNHERPSMKSKNFLSQVCLREYSVKVPAQRNTYDCGIHLLCSFEKFFEKPLCHNMEIRSYHDLTNQWSFDTRAKRDEIRRLIEGKE